MIRKLSSGQYRLYSRKIDPGTGLPYEFLIGSSYHYGLCESGQWTSFKMGTQSAADMKDLIKNGNPGQLIAAVRAIATGDHAWRGRPG